MYFQSRYEHTQSVINKINVLLILHLCTYQQLLNCDLGNECKLLVELCFARGQEHDYSDSAKFMFVYVLTYVDIEFC